MLDDHAREQVPIQKGVSGWHIGLIYIGIGLALPAFLLGSQIGVSLGLTDTMLAIVASGVILTLVGGATGAIGARVRLSTYLITQITFGKIAAKAINLLIAGTIMGWFGITISLLARSLDSLFINQFSLDFGVISWSLVGGALMISTAVWGFKGLDKLSLVVVPLLFGLLTATNWHVLGETDLTHILGLPGDGNIPFGAAVSMMAGGFMVGAANMPDIARYGRGMKDGAIGAFLCFLPGMFVILILSALPPLATGQMDIIALMTGFGWPIAATLVVVMAAWSSNDNNLYSASLSVASVTRTMEKWKITVILGAFGTVLAILGILDGFTTFLSLLGVVIPPVAGVYIADWFVRREDYQQADIAGAPNFRPVAILSWVTGSLVAFCTLPENTGGWGVATLTGISVLDGLLVGAIALLILSRIRK
uniref:Cytosine permease n=1 Tax=Candidatus Kentrum sp. UNK TaxID=2126344 RepID=A0A451B2F3_9GAMM|nr:MAG: cytosine permease [Candidatus Kentron sp. UNK]VFK72461.1 MAG: cytosine permease [Candidatus Kentron sp. UNK]